VTDLLLVLSAPVASKRLELLGAPLDPLTLRETVAVVEAGIDGRRPTIHACVNAAKLVRLLRDDALRRALWSCDLVTADGQAVVWAARLLGRPLPERVAGIDLMEALLARAEQRGFRVYLLGARPEVLERAAAVLRGRHPRLRLVGTRHGYFDPAEEPDVVAEIAAARPEVLLVALDTPRKELFLAENGDRLGVLFAMGVGGAFDVLAGRRRRAPGWAQRAGLEWAFRLAQEPARLGRRYLLGNVRFTALVLGELARTRIARIRRAGAR
jgi:N-acetylglucosaminyldiphosphoundecaprenol N-acetyl-beta-D-mannosaminyltransferase